MATPAGKKQVNVLLPEDVAAKLRRESFERDISQGDLVAEALRECWEREKERDK